MGIDPDSAAGDSLSALRSATAPVPSLPGNSAADHHLFRYDAAFANGRTVHWNGTWAREGFPLAESNWDAGHLPHAGGLLFGIDRTAD